MIKMNEKQKIDFFSTSILLIFAVITLAPILLIVIASLTKENFLISNGYSYFPKEINLDAYYYMLKKGSLILRAYGISFSVTTIGTVLSVILTTMIAYPMSRKDFKYRNVLAFFVFFTMLFSGGIVPSYILWSKFFHIKNTLWALIFPNYLVGAFNIFLVRNYYSTSIPDSIIESAYIDGASEIRVFVQIILPLAIPVVATITLFTGLLYWNDWVNCLYYVTKPQYFGIQNLLMRIMENVQYLKSGSANSALGLNSVELPGNAVRMAMAVIGILPIVIIYPFVQKHFIKGVVIGAVKG